MNNVNLIGNITKDLELKELGENKVCNFSIAVNRGSEADFFNCVAWNKTAESLVKYCKKGSKVAVSGRLENRTYADKDGNNRTITNIIANTIDFLNSALKGKEVDDELAF